MTAELRVLQPGRSVVTDLGRRLGPSYGMPTNGALDQTSARIANALVGNVPQAPLLELTAFDFSLIARGDVLVSVTGATADVDVDGHPEQQWYPVLVRSGQRLAVRGIRDGLRVYIAVHGGFEAEQLLGSCAPDTVLGFGMVLKPGTMLTALRTVPGIGQPGLGVPLFHFPVPLPRRTSPAIVEVTDGPDIADFGDTVRRLYAKPFRVEPTSNHVGLRFGGEPPVRQTTGEILSRGVPVGAVEVPAGDEVLILHRGRGVTAGYPVMGVVTQQGLDVLAQVRPGDNVMFRHTSTAAALATTRAIRDAVDTLAHRVQTAFAGLGLFRYAKGDDRWSAVPAPPSFPASPSTTR